MATSANSIPIQCPSCGARAQVPGGSGIHYCAVCESTITVIDGNQGEESGEFARDTRYNPTPGNPYGNAGYAEWLANKRAELLGNKIAKEPMPTVFQSGKTIDNDDIIDIQFEEL